MVDFNKLIDNYLLREHKPKEIGRYYPSEIGGCIRKTWFSYKMPRELDADTIKIFESGNMLHEFVAEVIKSEKNPEVELLQSELPVKIEENDFIISGRVDNLILVKIDDTKYLVEVKSCKYLPDEAREEHVMQLQLYMHATQIHEGIVLYIQKDNLQTAWFEFSYNKQMVENSLKRFRILHKSLISKNLPFAEAKVNEEKSWMCKYCPWLEECNEAGIDEKEKS